MTLRQDDLSNEMRYEEWIRIIERIYREQGNQAWSHYVFRLLRAIFITNQTLSDEGGFVFQWMVQNYVDATLMLLRRELDKEAGTENLRNLLFDMIKHPTVATRAQYRSKWGQEQPTDRLRADLAFDRFNPRQVEGDADSDYIDPDRIKADMDELAKSVEQARKFAEQTRAHRTPEQKVDSIGITFNAMHDAIAEVRRVVAKYYALLTPLSIAQWEPVPQYDTLRAFMAPWIVDRVAVEQALKEASPQ